MPFTSRGAYAIVVDGDVRHVLKPATEERDGSRFCSSKFSLLQDAVLNPR